MQSAFAKKTQLPPAKADLCGNTKPLCSPSPPFGGEGQGEGASPRYTIPHLSPLTVKRLGHNTFFVTLNSFQGLITY